MEAIKIKVFQKDIDNGVTGDTTRCPVALAFRRELGVTVRVGLTMASIRSDEYGYGRFDLPYHVTNWIEKWDRWANDPATFIMPEAFEFKVIFEPH